MHVQGYTRQTGRLRPARLHHILTQVVDQRGRPTIYNTTGQMEDRDAGDKEVEAWWQAAAWAWADDTDARGGGIRRTGMGGRGRRKENI
jgi:hypothetical protein